MCQLLLTISKTDKLKSDDENGHITLSAGKPDKAGIGDITATEISAKGNVTILAQNKVVIIDVISGDKTSGKGSASITAGDTATVTNVTAGKDVTLTAKNDVSFSDIKAPEKVAIKSTNGSIIDKDSSTSTTSGTIEFTAKNGSITTDNLIS